MAHLVTHWGAPGFIDMEEHGRMGTDLEPALIHITNATNARLADGPGRRHLDIAKTSLNDNQVDWVDRQLRGRVRRRSVMTCRFHGLPTAAMQY